jgi:hypothetical protein
MNRQFSLRLVFLGLVGYPWALAVQAAHEGLPLPRMVVAKTLQPPTIDGRIEAGEWDRAPACTGFVRAFEIDFGSVQSVAWVTFDDRFLYVAMKNWRGPNYTLLSKRGRRPDDANIVFDHANEIWFSPPSSPAETYQTLFNAYPAAFDVKMVPSVGSQAVSWSANWEIASSETKEHWIVEARAPIKAFGKERIKDGDTWRALFATDVLGGAGFTAWAPGGAFADMTRHGWLEFHDDAPVFQLLDVDTVHTGRIAFPVAVTAPSRRETQVTVNVRFGAGLQPAGGDRVLTKTLRVAAGQHETATLSGDITGLALPKRKVVVQQQPREEREVPAGYCDVTAKTRDGLTLYSQTFPFTIDGNVRTPPVELKATPYDKPFGVQAIYAPLSRKLIVQIDRLYLPGRGNAVQGIARLVDPCTGKPVAERPIAPFLYDLSEFPMDLAGVAVPIETEEAWTRNRAVAEENKKRKAGGKPERPLPFSPASYRLEMALADQAGKAVAATTTEVALKGYQFEWLPNSIGISDKVIPPWTPVRASGGQVSMWNKTYALNGLGLAERIVNDGRPQLSCPMKLVATVDGKETELQAAPHVRRTAEAWAEFSGTTQFGGLEIAADSRVEFDGCVLNTLRLQPRQATRLDRLSLVVRMPKSEAPCFVTTAGGWSATHGWTPAKWDSRETAMGNMRYNFVPYVLLTDSDRGFCLFVDSVRGWRLDPREPTMQLETRGDQLELRLNLVTRPGTVGQPLVMTYGWMVTPQKPQPKSWRAAAIHFHRPYPQAPTVFYGMDNINWAVLWPYYSSPYPWDYEKSKTAFDNARKQGIALCAGNIAHAIARYQDYKGRQFPELVTDWGQIPGNFANANVALSKGPNDFRLWHWDQWIRRSGMNGLYFDENYLSEDWNYLTGGAFLLPDEQVHPGYNYLGLREMDKRLRYLFHQHGLDGCRLWLHTTSGQPVHAWMPDVAMEAENVEPTSLEDDYLVALPDSRLRAIGMGRNLGAAPIIMCQADRHWRADVGPTLCHQFVGWVLAHDCLPEGSQFWYVLAAEMEMWQDDYRFLPYWKTGLGVESRTPDVIVSAHARPGHAALWIVNKAREDRQAVVQVDLRKLGFDPGKAIALDAETGERYPLSGGAVRVTVPKRLWRAVRLVQPNLLKGNQTFLARFDRGELAADEALGYRFAREFEGRRAESPGKTGRAVSLDQPLSFPCRHHVTQAAGTIEYQLQADVAKASGRLLTIEKLELHLNKDKLRLQAEGRLLGEGTLAAAAGTAWHTVAIAWKDGSFTVTWDGKPSLAATLATPLPIPPPGRGLEIANPRKYTQQPYLSIGPIAGTALDDLVMQNAR